MRENFNERWNVVDASKIMDFLFSPNKANGKRKGKLQQRRYFIKFDLMLRMLMTSNGM